MPATRDDERHLSMMRREIEQNLRDKQTLSALIHRLDTEVHALSACPRTVIDRMREELRIIEEIHGMALKGSLRVAQAQDQNMLQDALGSLEQLIELRLRGRGKGHTSHPPKGTDRGTSSPRQLGPRLSAGTAD